MPAYIPLSIATFSIIGEKQSRSLEPVLAAPIRTVELLAGKAIAALVPGVLAGWATYVVFVALASLVYGPALFGVVTDASWLAGVFLLGPAVGLSSVVAGVIVSARVNDPRVAQQIGGVIIVPIVGLVLVQATGTLLVGPAGLRPDDPDRAGDLAGGAAGRGPAVRPGGDPDPLAVAHVGPGPAGNLTYPGRPRTYDARMTGVRATRTEWILFLVLGFMWGSSYLFIKIAVDSFGTFTLIALRLLIGAAFLWVAFRLNGTSLPRERRIYGHLVVMALINITIPFAPDHLGRAVGRQRAGRDPQRDRAADGDRHRADVPARRADPPQRRRRARGRVHRGRAARVAGPHDRDRGPGRQHRAARVVAGVRARQRLQPAQRPRPRRRSSRPSSRSRSRFIIVAVLALVLEQPWTARPDLGDWFSVVWLGVFGSGLAYVLYFRLLGRWGATRTSLVAYLLPVYGIVLGYLVLQEPVDATLIVGTALVIAGVALVNSPWGQRRLFRARTASRRRSAARPPSATEPGPPAGSPRPR